MTLRIARTPSWAPVFLALTVVIALGCRPAEKPIPNETDISALPAADQAADTRRRAQPNGAPAHCD